MNLLLVVFLIRIIRNIDIFDFLFFLLLCNFLNNFLHILLLSKLDLFI
jgi:hypothetical protein